MLLTSSPAGSGGSGCSAVTKAANGVEVLVTGRELLFGGSTATCGGILWLLNNLLLRAEGVRDSFDEAMAQFASGISDAGPASSQTRRAVFIAEGVNMVRFPLGPRHDLRMLLGLQRLLHRRGGYPRSQCPRPLPRANGQGRGAARAGMGATLRTSA
jgi:hypothetical protein